MLLGLPRFKMISRGALPVVPLPALAEGSAGSVETPLEDRAPVLAGVVIDPGVAGERFTYPGRAPVPGFPILMMIGLSTGSLEAGEGVASDDVCL